MFEIFVIYIYNKDNNKIHIITLMKCKKHKRCQNPKLLIKLSLYNR